MADDEIGIDEGRTKKKISKTTWIYLGLAAGALVLTYLIYEHSKGNSSSGSSSNPMGGTPINPADEVAVPTAASTYQPGTEMQAYQQGINDALSIVQAQQGTGAEGSSTTTPSTSSGSGTSSQTQPVTTQAQVETIPVVTPNMTTWPTTQNTTTTSTYTPPTSYQLVSNDPNYHFTQPYNPPTPSSPVLSQYGGGFAPSNVSDRAYPYQIGGTSYHWVSNPTAAARDIAEGKQLYYSPSPGEMVPVTGALPYATPEYVQQ
jgi:hypothetical protein